MENKEKEQLIETREIPFVSFCAICDKPIYLDEEYEEFVYYDNPNKKHLTKKDLTHGYAHKHCLEEKQKEVEVLKGKYNKSMQFVLALAIVVGFVFALTLMLILLFNNVHVALAIVLPWVSGYSITSEIYILFADNKLGNRYQDIANKLIKLPITIWNLDQAEIGWFFIIKILLLIVLVPLGYIALVVLFALSLLISMVMFPVILIKNNK